MAERARVLTEAPPEGFCVDAKGLLVKEETLKGYSKADYHLHTSVGDGVMTPEEIVDYSENSTDLKVIAITDHDKVKGGFIAQEHADRKQYKIEVIAGEEVSTLRGHLIGLFMKRRVRRYTCLVDTIKDIHGQGGICIVPHPLSWLTTSIGKLAFKKVFESKEDDVYFDAVELLNPAIAGRVTGDKALKMNLALWRLPVAGGSDSHSIPGIGSAYTWFRGNTAEDFRKSIVEGSTLFGGRYWDLEEHLALFWEKFKRFKVF